MVFIMGNPLWLPYKKGEEGTPILEMKIRVSCSCWEGCNYVGIQKYHVPSSIPSFPSKPNPKLILTVINKKPLMSYQ